MAFKDALLQVSSYPEPSSAAAIKQAIDLAAALDTHLSSLTFKMDFPMPGNVLANALLDLPGMVAAEHQKVRDECAGADEPVREAGNGARCSARADHRDVDDLRAAGRRH